MPNALNIWDQLEIWLDRLKRLCVLVGSVALVVLVATFGWLVFGRYVLNQTPTWVEQLALLLICYITFLGAAIGIHEQSHLGVTFLRDALPARIRQALLLLTDLCLAIFGAVMLAACVELFEFGWSTRLPMLNIPESFRTLSAVLCGGLMIVFAGARVLLRGRSLMRGEIYENEKVI
ncbi:C4-dicarboxylate ABC transporter permease [Labrenzia sp. CP4]|jgi:TRAP-type C4-dicarboxylate transport system permease small subunit|uniref:TRAP transporter small permease n=1 Tax=Labrenzia sp. CP4 TaxID=1674922 RepID=UPI000784C8FD|nr:TRAP transporter small permease [Labrenzia sp. CP4]AMN51400.1 C4-dicarboxylate ABC transporter permease [Labrenzia sp. CP4]